MIWFVGFTLLTVVGIALVVGGFYDVLHDLSGFALAIGLFALAVGGIGSIAVGVTHIEQGIVERNCARYATQIDRETRYVELSFFDYGCYVKTDNGWVLRGSQIEVQTIGDES